MHLLSPWWLLLFLPLAGLLILLYLLKLRRRNHVVPSIFLWDQALQDLQANAPLQKLRRNLLLLLQLIVLLLVVLALVRPAMQWRKGAGRNMVLVLDVSASMRATDVLSQPFRRRQTPGAEGGGGSGPARQDDDRRRGRRHAPADHLHR